MSTALVVLLISHATLAADPRPGAAPTTHSATASPHGPPTGGAHGAQPVGSSSPTHAARPANVPSSSSIPGAHAAAPVASAPEGHGGHGHGHGHGHGGPRAHYGGSDSTVTGGVVVIYGENDEVTGTTEEQLPPPGPEQVAPPEQGDPEAEAVPPEPPPETPLPGPQDIVIEDDSSGPTIYRWQDADGSVHYSDADLVPDAAKANAVKTSGDPILVTRPAAK
jgi:hypothetical protein